jgi:hypothetical protein
MTVRFIQLKSATFLESNEQRTIINWLHVELDKALVADADGDRPWIVMIRQRSAAIIGVHEQLGVIRSCKQQRKTMARIDSKRYVAHVNVDGVQITGNGGNSMRVVTQSCRHTSMPLHHEHDASVRVNITQPQDDVCIRLVEDQRDAGSHWTGNKHLRQNWGRVRQDICSLSDGALVKRAHS